MKQVIQHESAVNALVIACFHNEVYQYSELLPLCLQPLYYDFELVYFQLGMLHNFVDDFQWYALTDI
jgi:hypothetical protein